MTLKEKVELICREHGMDIQKVLAWCAGKPTGDLSTGWWCKATLIPEITRRFGWGSVAGYSQEDLR